MQFTFSLLFLAALSQAAPLSKAARDITGTEGIDVTNEKAVAKRQLLDLDKINILDGNVVDVKDLLDLSLLDTSDDDTTVVQSQSSEGGEGKWGRDVGLVAKRQLIDLDKVSILDGNKVDAKDLLDVTLLDTSDDDTAVVQSQSSEGGKGKWERDDGLVAKRQLIDLDKVSILDGNKVDFQDLLDLDLLDASDDDATVVQSQSSEGGKGEWERDVGDARR